MPVEFSYEIESLPIQQVYPDLNQPRKYFDIDSIYELSNSIKRSGLIKPILVEKVSAQKIAQNSKLENMLLEFDDIFGDEFYSLSRRQRKLPSSPYVIIVGHRRFEAHWRAGIPKIRAQVVSNISDVDRLALQIAEDSQEAIPPHEIAEDIASIYYALTRLENKYVALTTVAERLGRSTQDVDLALNYHDLCVDVQRMVIAGMLDYRVAAEVGRTKNPQSQKEIAYQALTQKWSSKRAREFVAQTSSTEYLINSHYLQEAKRAFDEGTSLDRITRTLCKRMQQQMSCDSHEATSPPPSQLIDPSCLPVFIAEYHDMQIKEAQALSAPERARFLARSKPQWSRIINENIFRYTRERDLFGVPIVPKKDTTALTHRSRWYTVLNDAIAKAHGFAQLCQIDIQLSKIADSHGLVSLTRPVRAYLEDLVKNEDSSKPSQGTRFIDRRGVLGLSATEFDPKYNPNFTVEEIPLHKIRPDPRNVRKTFDRSSIERLATSILHNGLIEPLLVEQVKPDVYQIITGHRRYKAHQVAKISTARCIRIDQLSALDRKIIQIIEDSQKPFRPEERARYWFILFKLLNQSKKISIPEFAEQVGKSESAVRRAFSFLSLSKKIQSLVDLGCLTYSAAHEISLVPTRFTETKRKYKNVDIDVYDSAEAAFSSEFNSYEDVQLELALNAAYFRQSAAVVRHEIDRQNPSKKKDESLLFDDSLLARIGKSNQRLHIVQDFSDTLTFLPGSLRSLEAAASRTNCKKNIVYHPRVQRKLRELVTGFHALEKIPLTAKAVRHIVG